MKPTHIVKKVIVHVLIVFSFSVVGLSFADPGNGTRPGGGYHEPIRILYPEIEELPWMFLE